jgi:hypothetical protein
MTMTTPLLLPKKSRSSKTTSSSPSSLIKPSSQPHHNNNHDDNYYNGVLRKTKQYCLSKDQFRAIKIISIVSILYVFVIHQMSSVENNFYRHEGHNNNPNYFSRSRSSGSSISSSSPWITHPAWTCQWSPSSPEQCNMLLAHRLPPLSPSKKQRWLFFGDSTMKRPFSVSNLQKFIVEDPLANQQQVAVKDGDDGGKKDDSNEKNDDDKEKDTSTSIIGNTVDPCYAGIKCEERHVDRCDHDKVFKFDRVDEWQSPIYFPNFEGPANYAKDKPYCSDCGGCDPHFLHCEPVQLTSKQSKEKAEQCKSNKTIYGGFMKVEFAKDVELQTPMYRTTQENTAFYLNQHFNTPYMVQEWGKPICVIGTGLHDMILLLKTEHFHMLHFIKNVEWYLMIMKNECSHIVWVTNTAPTRENKR